MGVESSFLLINENVYVSIAFTFAPDSIKSVIMSALLQDKAIWRGVRPSLSINESNYQSIALTLAPFSIKTLKIV